MNAVCAAFPQEWPALAPGLEYLYATAPQGPHGISAHDLETAWGITSPLSRLLEPFKMPRGLAETEICAHLFCEFLPTIYAVLEVDAG